MYERGFCLGAGAYIRVVEKVPSNLTSKSQIYALLTAASISERTQKFLMNSIRQDFGFEGVPIRIVVRRKQRTAAAKKR